MEGQRFGPGGRDAQAPPPIGHRGESSLCLQNVSAVTLLPLCPQLLTCLCQKMASLSTSACAHCLKVSSPFLSPSPPELTSVSIMLCPLYSGAQSSQLLSCDCPLSGFTSFSSSTSVHVFVFFFYSDDLAKTHTRSCLSL